MDFKENYTTDPADTKKILISNESYAVCNLIEELTKAIERLRGSL